MGKPMNKIGEWRRKTKNGYIQPVHITKPRTAIVALCTLLVLKLKTIG